jgi:uncharacterized membrane protein YhaH (DUF805 family)
MVVCEGGYHYRTSLLLVAQWHDIGRPGMLWWVVYVWLKLTYLLQRINILTCNI